MQTYILFQYGKIRNESMIENLCRKPAAKSPVKIRSDGPSYLRMNKDTTTAINPVNKNVATIYRTKSSDAKRYGFQKSPHLVRQGERVPTTTGAKKTAIKTKTKRLSHYEQPLFLFLGDVTPSSTRGTKRARQ